jgi:tRNA(Ile)-lysidine synthetase-like protein
VARDAARDRAAWNAVLDTLTELELLSENDGISVAASSLAGYDSALAHALIRAMSRRAGCHLTPARVGRVQDLLRSGMSGAQVPLGGGWKAELSFGRLRIMREASTPAREPWPMEGPTGEGVWGRWVFRWGPAIAPEQQPRAGMSAWISLNGLIVRSWLPGEKLKPLGGRGRRLIVRCFQEVRIPRSRRESWPVVARDKEIVWIPGVCRSDAMLPAPGTEALRVDAEYT